MRRGEERDNVCVCETIETTELGSLRESEKMERYSVCYGVCRYDVCCP